MPDKTAGGLYAKIAHAQATMPPLKRDKHVDVKNRDGTFLYSYDYISEDAVTTAMREHLATNGVATFVSYPEAHDLGEAGGENVVRVKVAVLLVDSSTSEREVVTGWGDGTDKGDKAIGKAQTSGLRQLLGKLLLQAGGDDGEAANTTTARSASSGSKSRSGTFQATTAQVNRLFAIANSTGYTRDEVKLAIRIATRTDANPAGTDDGFSIPSKAAYEKAAAFLQERTTTHDTALGKMAARVDELDTGDVPYDSTGGPNADDAPGGGYE